MRALFLSKLRPELRPTLIVCGALGLFLATAATIAMTISHRSSGLGSTYLAGAHERVPILFVPDRGNVCKQRMLKNSDWTIADGGYVVCDDEVSWNVGAPSPKYSAESRIDAVRTGFSRK
jgi:hypothetical protein